MVRGRGRGRSGSGGGTSAGHGPSNSRGLRRAVCTAKEGEAAGTTSGHRCQGLWGTAKAETVMDGEGGGETEECTTAAAKVEETSGCQLAKPSHLPSPRLSIRASDNDPARLASFGPTLPARPAGPPHAPAPSSHTRRVPCAALHFQAPVPSRQTARHCIVHTARTPTGSLPSAVRSAPKSPFHARFISTVIAGSASALCLVPLRHPPCPLPPTPADADAAPSSSLQLSRPLCNPPTSPAKAPSTGPSNCFASIFRTVSIEAYRCMIIYKSYFLHSCRTRAHIVNGWE